MNIRLLVAGLALVCSTALLANPARQPPPDSEAAFERLAATLQLLDAQRPQVSELLRRHHAKMREQHERGRESREAADAEIDAALGEVLSAEQMQRWREHREARRPPPPRGGDGATGRRQRP